MTIPQGWLGANDHRGWRGVTDNLHLLLAVNYVPQGGFLACHFCTGDDLVFEGVPEKCYQAIITSPYGGSYYRKYVNGKYPTPFVDRTPYIPKEKPNKKKLSLVKEVPDGEAPPQMSLFAQLDTRARKRSKSISNGSMKEWREHDTD